AFDAVLGRERCAAGDVPEDGVGFGKESAGRHFQERHLAVRILLQELRRMALALEDIDFDQPIRNAELRQSEPRLVAIPRTLHRIEREHGRSELPWAGIILAPVSLERGDVVTARLTLGSCAILEGMRPERPSAS